ncbi:MAG: tRNA (adenosine(37)-N6)-threonylcarbamoyltransferase complex dimerization subunit type 1 TsaB [Erythrobacter sp.]|jgi:tRNA threonylcarbamoyl adenosine modification protein YeaZ|nr:tRNA (adenosine(37)-N6)-threonylcarbamoyltransferase complex dimerization subunit type 1 TsaB [Erythrobacter sp.]
MRTLAIETATEACSLALFDSGELIARDHRVLGRGHAEALIPMIAGLPDRGRAERILVSLGPGSFTGVRIGLASARALGVAWGSQVLGYPTLALVAAMARAQRPGEPLTVSMKGGHGEWFVQNFDSEGGALGEAESLAPDAAARNQRAALIVGSSAEALVAHAGGGLEAIALLPEAARVMLLDQSALTSRLSPIYGRPPDARPQSPAPQGNSSEASLA